jgi:aspartate carbamoyltransferase catalytic subunit
LDPKRKWKIAFFGDVVRSRVARADIQIFRKLGYSLSVVNDGSLETEIFSKAYKIPKIERLSLRTQEVVICLRIQKERGSERLLPPLCRQDIGSKTYVMHPGPVIVGEDLAHDLCDFSDSRSLIHRQVANGRRVRRALLSELSAEGAKT